MTEADWLTSRSALWLLSYLARLPDPSDRKARLAAVACCRRAAEWHSDLLLPDVIDGCEWCADEPDSWRTLFALNRRVQDYRDELRDSGEELGLEFFEYAAAVERLTGWPIDPAGIFDIFEWCRDAICGHDDFVAGHGETLFQLDIIREIYGNPFRPVAFDPSWRTSSAVALAAQMYGSRDFAAMPILADALQEAGCDHADILAHCRDPHGAHARGCWVVDLVLGKS